MDLNDAIDLIRPAVAGRRWADLGAGTGLFTRALVALLGPDAEIVALDRDAVALRTLRRHVDGVRTVQGDLTDLPASLGDETFDGAVLANALHFVPDAAEVLAAVAPHLAPDGRVVVVEYDRQRASRWVPHPLPPERLAEVAANAGFEPPLEIGRRPSSFGGTLVASVLTRPASPSS